MELSVFIGPLVSAAVVFAGSYMAFSQRIVRLESKLDEYSRRVDKHNNVIERTFVLESDMKSAFHSIDQLRDDMHELRDR